METNLQIRRGDDYTISLDFDVDITGWQVVLTVKDVNGTVVLSKSTTDHDDAAEGQTSIEISHAESLALNGTYYYTVVATKANTTMKGVLIGVITFDEKVISSDITTSVTESGVTIEVTGGTSTVTEYTWTSEVTTYETTSVNPSITFAETFVAGTLAVYKNGVLQKKDTDYTEKDGLTGLDWIGTLYDGDDIEVRYAYA